MFNSGIFIWKKKKKIGCGHSLTFFLFFFLSLYFSFPFVVHNLYFLGPHAHVGDQERLFVYLLTAGSVGVILCIVAVAVRLVVLKQHESVTDTHSTSSGKGGVGALGSGTVGGADVEGVGETTIPNGFNDTISEVDADIDLQTPIPVPSVSKNEVRK